jgi:GDP-L-fucose synthase
MSQSSTIGFDVSKGVRVRIVVAGGTGLIGSAIASEFKKFNHEVISVSRRDVDLTDGDATRRVIMKLKPHTLVDAAARVGGIGANNSKPVEFLVQNLSIQNNLMLAAHEAKVSKFIFLASSCIYPRDCPQPIKEAYLHTGKLEETNSAYAVAKIAGIELVNSFRKEFGVPWISLMPTNLYGPRDNFALEGSHVLPALIRKFVDAESQKKPDVELWGDGSPLREFCYVDDVASAVVLAASNYDNELHLNIGSGQETSVKELALLIAELSGFKGQIHWDKSKPNGTPRKILDSSRMRSLGWAPKVPLRDGIRMTIDWYRQALDSGDVRL